MVIMLIKWPAIMITVGLVKHFDGTLEDILLITDVVLWKIL